MRDADPPPLDAEPSSTAAVLFWRWLFSALFLAAGWFVLWGLLNGFGGRLWLQALLFGTVVSALMQAEEEWRARRDRRQSPKPAD